MKVTVTEQPSKPDRQYPYLAKYNYDADSTKHSLVVFTSENTGMCVAADSGFGIGSVRDDWLEKEFDQIYGKVEMTFE